METKQNKKYTTIGLLSFIFAIISILLIVLIFVLIFANIGSILLVIISIFSILLFIFPIISIVLGAIAYFGKGKDKFGLAGFTIGIILICMAPVSISATTYVYFSGMLSPEPSHYYTMSAIMYSPDETNNNVTFKVTDTDYGIPWSEVYATWSSGYIPPGNIIDENGFPQTGLISVGDYFVIELESDGTYSIDLIYDGNIIWTSPDFSI